MVEHTAHGAPKRVLFVCTGNICRSPTAEGVARALAAERGLADCVEVDSAGTHGYHVGDPPDPRSVEAARRRGVDLSPLRARTVAPGDFDRFDLIVALDRGHLDLLERRCPPERRDRLSLLMSFAAGLGVKDVPDPYYEGAAAFERTPDVIEAAGAGLLDTLVSPGR
jgi:protein-tyrosine phosphatase